MPDYTAIASKANNDPITTTDWQALADDLALHQTVTTVRPVNSTGGTVTRGYVGVLDPAAGASLIAASGAADNRRVVVVQDASVVTTGLVYCQVSGRVAAVNVVGAVGLYQPLETSGTVGRARQGNSAPFAIALEAFAGPGNGQIQALLIPAIAGGSGSYPTGLPSATHGPFSFHINDASLHAAQIAAPGSGLSVYITSIRVQNNNTTPSVMSVFDHTATLHTENLVIAGVQGAGVEAEYEPPWEIGDDDSLDIQQTATADVYGTINFYVAAAS